MKQIIERSYDGCIRRKCYINDRNEKHGFCVGYARNNYVYRCWIRNFVNGKLYGLDTDYYVSGKIEKYKYHL